MSDKEGLPIRPIFISVDPDRDNVSQMRYYAQGEGGHAYVSLCQQSGVRVVGPCLHSRPCVGLIIRPQGCWDSGSSVWNGRTCRPMVS